MSDSIVMSPNGVVNTGFDGDEIDLPEIPVENNFSTPTRSTRSKREQAVCVRNAYKHYGSSKCPNRVLQNLNMTVTKGSIYGLLGASGCGKTTLLSCLVGRKHLNSGEIWVLGGKPGTRSSGIPGRRVGYMPQEIALYPEFSIRETMMFFGWIFSMSTKEIEERLEFLLKFLDLPSKNRLVKNLSGGQQRRVSFAVALMHDPELIILDEPTVGVDPLLRQSIWNHLVQITKDGNKTVIITTHYIEEARQAHCIGLMRNGRLLAEASPLLLLSTYGSRSLEDVFLLLSRMENVNARERTPQLSNYVSVASQNWRTRKIDGVYGTEEKGVTVLNYHRSDDVLAESNGHYTLNNNLSQRETKTEIDICKLNLHGKMRALMQKNILRLWRNLAVLFIIFALPVTIVILFCLAVGRPMKNIHLAVVNNETDWRTKYCPVDTPIDFRKPATFKYFSCHYLDMLPKDSLIIDYYENVDKAKMAVEIGSAWGVIYFPQNFSFNVARRYSVGKDATAKILNASTMRVWLDMSNQQIGLTLRRDLQYAFRDFAKWLLHEFETSIFRRNASHHMYWEKVGDLPLQHVEPIYGDSSPDFQDFVAAGVILTIVFFLAVSLTASALIGDRAEGLQDRSWVAGVSPTEILISHVLTQFIIMCCQTALVLIFMFLVFEVQCKGDILWITVITLFQGLNGMSFGFLISSICDLERNAIQMALGSFYPILMLSGVIWPLEGMGTIMRYISYALPLTLATSSLRSMLSRGWGTDEPDVYWGFVASLVWIVLFLSLSFILVRSKKN